MTPERLILAQSILDEHFDNVYFKIDLAAASWRRWPRILIVVLAGVFAVVGSYEVPLFAPLWHGVENPPLGGIVLLAVAAALGALGAAVSRSLTALGRAGRIPEFLQGTTDSMLRLLVGAGSAIGVVVLAQAGLMPFKTDPPTLHALGFVAGFSDRLLTLAIERSIAQAES